MVEATIEKETSAVKESIALIKKSIIAKKKNPVVPNEDPPSTRNNVRLSVKVTK